MELYNGRPEDTSGRKEKEIKRDKPLRKSFHPKALPQGNAAQGASALLCGVSFLLFRKSLTNAQKNDRIRDGQVMAIFRRA